MNDITELLESVRLNGITRIDVGLEGNWSPTVVTVWNRETGIIRFDHVKRAHPIHKPSLELYFHGTWLGIHCFCQIKNELVFDQELAERVIEYVEGKL